MPIQLEQWVVVTKDNTGVLTQHEIVTKGLLHILHLTADKFKWSEIVLICKKDEIFCTKWLTNGGNHASVKA